MSAIRDYGEEARHFEDTVESDAEKQMHSTIIAPMSQPTMVDESVSAMQGNWDAKLSQIGSHERRRLKMLIACRTRVSRQSRRGHLR